MASSNVGLLCASCSEQVTFVEKQKAFPDSRQVTFTAMPSTVRWNQVARVLIPGGGQINRQSLHHMWRNVCLKWNACLGSGAPIGHVFGIAVSPAQALCHFESIEVRVDNQQLFIVENGSLGVIAQKFFNSLVKAAPSDPVFGHTIIPYLRGLKPTDVGAHGDDVFNCQQVSDKGVMHVACSLPLSYVFDGLFDDCDPQFFGRELEVVITVVNTPALQPNPTQGDPPIPGFLFQYSQRPATGDFTDCRSEFQITNLRIEFDQLAFAKSPFPTTRERVHTVNTWFASPITTLDTGLDYRVFLGQHFRVLTNIRTLHLYCQRPFKPPPR